MKPRFLEEVTMSKRCVLRVDEKTLSKDLRGKGYIEKE
jgi:hypothetical protein